MNQNKKIVLLLILVAFVVTVEPGMTQFGIEGKRRTQFAGTWYDDDPDSLARELDSYMQKASPLPDLKSAGLITSKDAPPSTPVIAIVAPHAGYMFSGQAAAYSYKAIPKGSVKRVFLLGPSHYVGIRGAALPMAVTFATPFGDLDVDKDVISELKQYPSFTVQPEVHRGEHSLEMQLPFIRYFLGDVKIVPIIVGILPDDSDIKMIAEILKRYIRPGDLVVVSSDFTHYGPRYEYQPFKDNIRENIRKMDGRAYACLEKHSLDELLSFQKETKDTICGFYPLCVLIDILPEGVGCSLLKYYTSQDATSQEKEDSVSYLAIAFSGKDWGGQTAGKQEHGEKFSASDKQTILTIARKTVEMYVRDQKEPKIEDLGVTLSPALKANMGAFVTLYKKGQNPKELRGCIGYIWPFKPLYQSVIDNAISACSRDYRFYSVKPEELKDIFIEVSVLSPPHRVNSYKDIVLGHDGIVLYKQGAQSVFLPFVPTEFGWDLKETLTQLSKKAGLDADAWKEGAAFDVFQAEVFEESHH